MCKPFRLISYGLDFTACQSVKMDDFEVSTRKQLKIGVEHHTYNLSRILELKNTIIYRVFHLRKLSFFVALLFVIPCGLKNILGLWQR